MDWIKKYQEQIIVVSGGFFVALMAVLFVFITVTKTARIQDRLNQHTIDIIEIVNSEKAEVLEIITNYSKRMSEVIGGHNKKLNSKYGCVVTCGKKK